MERPVRSMYMDIVEQRALDSNVYRVTIAANERVRQAPDLDFAGLSTENYARNPVVMWAHDVVGRSPSGGLPIGRTLAITRTPEGRVTADFEFLSDDPFAQRVKNAWDKEFLQAASISWIPLESVPAGNGRWKDTSADLLEWSIVAVPADPDALREAHRRLISSLVEEPPEGESGTADHAVGSPAARNGSSNPMPQGVRVLCPDDYDHLSEALTLLRVVVDGIEEGSHLFSDVTCRHGSARPQRSRRASFGADADSEDGALESPAEADTDEALVEVRFIVEALRDNLAAADQAEH